MKKKKVEGKEKSSQFGKVVTTICVDAENKKWVKMNKVNLSQLTDYSITLLREHKANNLKAVVSALNERVVVQTSRMERALRCLPDDIRTKKWNEIMGG